VMRQCFPDEFPAWQPKLRELIPSVGMSLSDDPVLRGDVRGFVETSLNLREQPLAAVS
jgi:malate dehydrogenase (quinone)